MTVVSSTYLVLFIELEANLFVCLLFAVVVVLLRKAPSVKYKM